MAAWMLMTTLFAAEAQKPAPAKVYVVYVTVVEIDAEGNETVLFTPKVQTTGNPAGATVEHVDGRSFEFNCKMAASAEPALERPPVSAKQKPFHLTVGATDAKGKLQKDSVQSKSLLLRGEEGGRRTDDGVARGQGNESDAVAGKHSPPLPNPLPRSGGEGTKQKGSDAEGTKQTGPVGEFFVRNYDVSWLIDVPSGKSVTETHFLPVIQTIKAVAEIETWDDPAAIKPFTSTKSLVIKQTAAGHEAVAEALNKLQTDNK